MAVDLTRCAVVVPLYWSTGTLSFKGVVLPKVLSIQYDVDAISYTIFAIDGPVGYVTNIYLGTVPDPASYSQAQNDADKSDFVTNYLPYCNGQIISDELDPRFIYRFGNLTSISVSEVLMCSRGYTEQVAQALRSVVSTSTQDKAGGTGAFAVRITYLDSNYVVHTEDVTLNGTTAVNTVASDIRFIEKFQVIQGAAAAGAIKIMTLAAGAGTEFCGIGAGTEDAYLCHHYVPAGMRCWVYSVGATVDNNVNFKLKGQQRFGANLVDQNLYLVNCFIGSSSQPAGRLEFDHPFDRPLLVGEKCYIRLTAVPGQTASTISRSTLVLWEDKA